MATQKQFIIKADDYGRGGANLDPWRRFIDCALDEYLTLSIGVVASEFTQNKAVPLYLRSIVEEYGIEVWNHSNTHPNFTQLKKDQIEKEIFESQKIIENELGIRPKIFGPPFNKIDQASAQHVIDTNEFTGYYALDGLIDRGKNIELKYFSGVEIGTDIFRPMRLEVFNAEMIRREWPDFIVFQLHPYYWSNECLNVYKKVLALVKDRGYISITGGERVRYWEKKVSGDNVGIAGYSIADNLIYEENALSYLESTVKEGLDSKYRVDSAYYFRMLRGGTSEICQFLKSLGFPELPKVSGKLELLDIGAGIGNWTSSMALLSDSHITAIDREDVHLELIAKHIDTNKITIKIAAIEDVSLKPSSYSGIVCNNTISYLQIVEAFDIFWDAVVFGGGLFLGLQNRLYPLRDAIEASKRFDLSKALSFLDRIYINECICSGFSESAFIRYWNSEELSKIGITAGFKLQRRNISPPGSYGLMRDFPLYSGYFFIKTRAAEKFKKENLAKDQIKVGKTKDINSILEQLNFYIEAKGLAIGDIDRSLMIDYLEESDLISSEMKQHSIEQLLFCLTIASYKKGILISQSILIENSLFSLVANLYGSLLKGDANGINLILNSIDNKLLNIGNEEISHWM